LAELFAVPPRRPGWVRGGAGLLIWSGPDRWLAAGPALDVPRLAAALAGLAAIADQSDGRALLRLSGPRVRDVLAKGAMIDLHPRAFGTSDAAVTAIAQIGVEIWQVDDRPAFELAIARSMAGSFWSWLAASAAEFGFEVLAPAHA
ncbi:sarcosine oxidase subunit gamma, partial [Propylenella binzhouense]